MHPADPFENPASASEDDSLQREIAYLETWLEYRPAVAPIVLSRLGELGRELRADLPRLLAERKVRANLAKLRAERLKRDRMREAASVAAMIATAPSLVIAAPAVAAAETTDFQVAGGEEAAAATLLLRVMDAVSGKPLPGVRLMTVAQEVVAVTDATGQATLPAKFASEGVLSLERDGYPIVLIQGAKLAGRTLVAMKPFSDEKTALKKKPTATAKAKSTGPIVKIPAPPTPSAIDEAMAALRGAPNAPDTLAAVEPPHGPEAPVQPVKPVAAAPVEPAPQAPVVEAPVVEAPVVQAAAPVHQAAAEGDYGPIAEPPAHVAATPAGVQAQVAPAPKAPVVALKKPAKTAKVAKPALAAKPAPAKVAQAKPAPVISQPIRPMMAAAPSHAEAKPVTRPLLPIAPPIVSVSEAQKLATAIPVEDTYGPMADAPVQPVAAVPATPAVVAPAPQPVKAAPVIALKKSTAKPGKPTLAAKAKAPAKPAIAVAPKPAPVVIAQAEGPHKVFGPEPEVRPVLPLMPAPALPIEAVAVVPEKQVEPVAPVLPVEPAPVHGVSAAQAGHGVSAAQAGHGVSAAQAGHGVSAAQAGHGVSAAQAGAPVVEAPAVEVPAVQAAGPVHQAATEGDYGPGAPAVQVAGREVSAAQAPAVPVPVAHDLPVAHEAPVEPAAPVAPVRLPEVAPAVHYSTASAETSPTPHHDVYGPTKVAQAPDVAVPNHEAPMKRPATPREPVATHVATAVTKAVVVPKKALKPKAERPSHYKVRPGDSLSIIARDLLGDMMRWPELYAANRDLLTNPSWLPVGLSLKLPRPGEAVAAAPKKTYVVRHGDSLSLIAKRHLGDIKKWPEIYAANRRAIADPTLIFPGQRLVLPASMANAMPPLSWANLQASYAPAGMGGHDAGDEPRLAIGGEVKYTLVNDTL